MSVEERRISEECEEGRQMLRKVEKQDKNVTGIQKTGEGWTEVGVRDIEGWKKRRVGSKTKRDNKGIQNEGN